jgi:hypothetical protein
VAGVPMRAPSGAPFVLITAILVPWRILRSSRDNVFS